MYKLILKGVLLIIILFYVNNYITKKIEKFVVRNLGYGNMSNTTILNNSNEPVIFKKNIKIGQKILTSRWFKIMEVSPNSKNPPPDNNYPTFSLLLQIFPNPIVEDDKNRLELLGSTQMFSGSIRAGDLYSCRLLRKDDTEDISFDYLVFTKLYNSINVWLHSTNKDINNVFGNIVISQPKSEKDTVVIKLFNKGDSPLSSEPPYHQGNDQFPKDNWPDNWINLQNDLVKRQVSELYTDIYLKQTLMNVEERISSVKNKIQKSRKEIENIKERTETAMADSDESRRKIEKATYDKTLIENKQKILQSNLPNCLNRPFNINYEDDKAEEEKCCPTGWYYNEDLGSTSEQCVTSNYPYQKNDQNITPAITCNSVGGVVNSMGIDSKKWSCKRFPERQYTMIVNSNKQELCGADNRESTLKFSGSKCGKSNDIEWDDVQAIKVIEPAHKDSSCGKLGEWNRSNISNVNIEKVNNYLGSCGKAPLYMQNLPSNITDFNSRTYNAKSNKELKSEINTLRTALNI